MTPEERIERLEKAVRFLALMMDVDEWSHKATLYVNEILDAPPVEEKKSDAT